MDVGQEVETLLQERGWLSKTCHSDEHDAARKVNEVNETDGVAYHNSRK